MAGYRYFISYQVLTCRDNTYEGNTEMITKNKITSIIDIRNIEKELKDFLDVRNVVVLNFRLYDQEEKIMDNGRFLEVCTQKVVDYFNSRKDKTDNVLITTNDVFVVWSCKTLQNNKALLSTNVPDGMYYELTYNGDKKELYMDAYKKWENICFEGVE